MEKIELLDCGEDVTECDLGELFRKVEGFTHCYGTRPIVKIEDNKLVICTSKVGA